MLKKGRLWGIGVGPGDPELLTLKAVRFIRACDVIAIPQKDPARCTALRIAAGAVPEVLGKTILALDMPMTRDQEVQDRAYSVAAERLRGFLAEGRDVAFLTLGDPAVYSTYGYLRACILRTGFEALSVPGVPSFCAAAAALGESLCEEGEPLHILPGADDMDSPGTRVFMKGGAHGAKQVLQGHAGPVLGAENAGMEGERLFRSLEEIPEDTGYFTLIIAKEN